VAIPSSAASEKWLLATQFVRYQTQTTVADSQPLLDIQRIGPIEVKSPATSIDELVRVVATTQPLSKASLIDDQVLSLP
jgi:hypothetical protein